MKIISVVGARPNFMKVAPIHKAFEKVKCETSKVNGEAAIHNTQFTIQHLICHTGQHYDEKMSKVFFDELELPKPDFYLGVGSGSHAEQTAKVMIEFEKILLAEKPDLVIVVGDVNSTIACSLTSVKLGIRVAHVEAGLRSFDRTMPEEINRILTDSIADFLFVTEKSGLEHLKNEGINPEKIYFVGNCMIDSLVHYLPKINSSQITNHYSLTTNNYIVATFHRPSNVDDKKNFLFLIEMLNDIAKVKKIIFPIHPRTRKNLSDLGLLNNLSDNIILNDPIGYIDFISLVKDSLFVITDSGGIQEETTFLGVPCITLRKTTERSITAEIGTNYLVGEDFSDAKSYISEILEGNAKKGLIPELWDGNAAERIVNILLTHLS